MLSRRPRMKLGFAVKVLGGGGLPSHDTRRWQSDPHLRVSLEYLRAIFGNDPDGVSDREALERALATWPDAVTPKIHYSSPKTEAEERRKKVGRRVERSLVLPQLRAHADLIDPIGFEHFVCQTADGLDFDVMLEAKAKDLALLRLREQLAARGVSID